jgi:DNA-directed RNA polymerase specialized sigma24 family protein
VEFRFFGDLEFQEIAEVMDISLSTVERDWRFARAWLQKRMVGSPDERR